MDQLGKLSGLWTKLVETFQTILDRGPPSDTPDWDGTQSYVNHISLKNKPRRSAKCGT